MPKEEIEGLKLAAKIAEKAEEIDEEKKEKLKLGVVEEQPKPPQSILEVL